MIERRTFESEVETRSAGENKLKIVGYAYKFGARSQNLGGFREVGIEGMGADSIKSDDIRALYNHDPNLVLGRSAGGNGTLRLSEDSTGLHYEVEADERQSYVRDLLIAMERGDVSQSSFGFRVNPDGEKWSLDDDETPLRSLTSIRLFDVSPVTYPAYLDATSGVSQRALDIAKTMTEKPDVVEVMLSPGFYRSSFPIDPQLAAAILRNNYKG